MPFQITSPLPARGSAEALRHQLIEHLLRTSPAVGERFLSDHELARIAGLSRPTVRRALDELHRQGWIERRQGLGTFIGPRAGMSTHLRDRVSPSSRAGVRLALLIHQLGDLGHDWYAAGVLSGIDEAADEAGVSIELLGDRDGDVKSISRRLLQTRPHVLAFTAPPPRNVMLIGEARRLDIRCIGTGAFLAALGIPSVCEDGRAGAAAAVNHLIERGHRSIALVLAQYPTPWVFQRRDGYFDGLTAVGIEPDERMVLWLSGDDDERTQAEEFRRFLDRRHPTAVLFGRGGLARALSPLISSGQLRVPQDLSIVTFDQRPDLPSWLGGVQPTTIELPLRAMGRRLAEMARQIVNGGDPVQSTSLPCSLSDGASVAVLEDKLALNLIAKEASIA